MTKYITIFSVLVGLSIGFASCLKDNTPPPLDSSYSVPNLVSFQDNGGRSGGGAGYGTTTTPFPLYNFSFSLLNDTAGFDAIVIYGPTATAPQDITLSIAVDTAALNSFNNANSTSYVAPDNTTYSFPSTVIIPKGKSQAFVHVTITASPTFDFTVSYALPLSIKSSSYGAVSANFGTEINTYVVKNQYDGKYSLQIKTTGWAAYGISDNDPGTYPGGMEMVSAGANSVSFYNGTTGLSDLEPAFTANNLGATGFGATTPLFTFDPTTNNLTSVVNTTPDDGRGRTLYLNPAVTDSRYDPSSKTIYAAYIMTQNSRPNQFIYDTLVYQGPR